MHHVRAYRVSPMHIAPHGRIRIQLIKEMILSSPPDRPVGIIHPVPVRKQMILRPQWIIGKFRDIVCRTKSFCKRMRQTCKGSSKSIGVDEESTAADSEGLILIHEFS